MLDDDGRLLLDELRVPIGYPGQRRVRLGRFVQRVILYGLDQLEVRLEDGVLLQHVQDEALFYCLLHRIEVERMGLAVIPNVPKHLQRRGFRRGSESKEREVGKPPLRVHLLDKGVLRVYLLGCLFLCRSLHLGIYLGVVQARQGQLHFGVRFAALRRMRFVDDDGELPARDLRLLANIGEFLDGGRDYLRT